MLALEQLDSRDLLALEAATTPAPSATQLVVVEDQQTTLTPTGVWNLAWVLNYFGRYQFGRSQWVTDRLAVPVHVSLLPKGAKPPVGAWNLILLDTSDQAGALGYHDDTQGTNIPFSDVFVQTSIADGADPAAVAAHELVEMIVDPWVEGRVPRMANSPDGTQYIVEPGDPVQGNDYDIGEPEGRPTGVHVCDFCLPAWWGLHQSGDPAQISYRRSVARAFELAPQGYISWVKAGGNPADPAQWQQSFGATQSRLPAWASRLPRIHP